MKNKIAHKAIQFFVVLGLLLFCLSSCQSRAETEALKIKAQKEALSMNIQTDIHALINLFNGDVGIYVLHLKKGIEFAYQENKLFPTASMIKVPIMAALFNDVESGRINYESMLGYDPNLINYSWKGDGAIERFRPGSKIYLSRVIAHMITFSDNHASLWLQGMVGESRINEWLAAQGFEKTRINSRLSERKTDYQHYGWGQTSAKEMAQLLLGIYEGRVVSQRASEEMYRTLTQSYWNDVSLTQVPFNIQVAAKSGVLSQSRSEVVLVNAPSGDYVFCVITNKQKDRSLVPDNEGYVLIRNLSKLLWQHFEPDSTWVSPQKPFFVRH